MKSIVISISLLALAAVAADPYIAYVYPVALQAGTTNRIVVGGQNHSGQLRASVSGDGVKVLDVTKVPGMAPPTGVQLKYLKGWLDSIVAGKREEPPLPEDPHISEWRECTWWRRLGELDDLERSFVEQFLFVPRNGLQMSPSLRDKAIVTVAVAPDAKPGRRELLLFNPGGSSAPHAFFVTAAPHVPEPLYVPPHRRSPGSVKRTPVASPLPVVLDGQIMPGETDRFSLSFDKGQRVKFTVTAREVLPYIGDAVPGFFNPILRLVSPSGKEVAFADDDKYRPDPVMTAVIPATGIYVLEVRDNLYRGREDFVYMVEVEDAAVSRDEARPSQPVVRRVGDNAHHQFDGVIDAPGKSAKHTFDIAEPGLRVIETVARGAGSPLDPVVTLYGPKGADGKPGPKIATWDDTTNALFVGTIAQAECDPVEYHNFKKPGRYTLVVKDRVNAGGKDYFYNVAVRKPSPDFTVHCTRSSFPAHKGDRVRTKFKIDRREGFDGEVKILDTPEVAFKGGVIPAGSNEVSIVAIGRMAETGRSEIEIFAEGLVNGEPMKRRVVPADEAEQAFAWTHLVPTRTFFCTYAVRKPVPPRAEDWPKLPYRLFADVQCKTNVVYDVKVGASSDERIKARAERRLRFRRVVRTCAEPALKRWQMNSFVCGGVTEFDDAKGVPIADPYAMRLMGVAQNAAPDSDVLVYAPSSHLAVAVSAVKQLKGQGWCADLLFEDRLSAIAWNTGYRIVYVPETIPCDTNTATTILKKLDGVTGAMVFEKKMPEGLEGKFVEKRGCRMVQRGTGRRIRIVCGPRAAALDLAWAKREPFADVKGLSFSRWKDGDETVYFLYNVGKERVSRKFKPSAKTVTAKILNPSNGAVKPLKVVDGVVELSLAPGEARWLRTYPFAAR